MQIIIISIILNFLTKILAFIREILLASHFGTSEFIDIYLVAIVVPSILFRSISLSIKSGYISINNKLENQHDKRSFFISSLILIISIAFSVIIIFSFFNIQINSIIAQGFDNDSLNLLSRYTSIIIISLIFIGINSIITGNLRSNNHHYIATIAQTPTTIAMIIFIVLASKYDNIILIYGYVFSLACQSIFLFIINYMFDYDNSIKKANINYSYMKQLSIISIPIFIGISVDKINTLVDRMIASELVSGSIAALTYADRLIGMVKGIIVLSIVSYTYPKLVRSKAKRNIKEFLELLRRSLYILMILLLPIVFYSYIESESIITFVYERGAFNKDSTYLTSSAFQFYIIGVIGYALREIMIRAHLAMDDYNYPMINGIIVMVINVILNIILAHYYQLKGLAVATSISLILSAISLIYHFEKKHIKISNLYSIKEITMISIPLLISLISMRFIKIINVDNFNINFILHISLYIVIYSIITIYINLKYRGPLK